MALQQGVNSFQANNLEIPLYWTLPSFQETLASNILLSDHRTRCKIAVTEKCARTKLTKQTPDTAEHHELFAIPVYRDKEFTMGCREKR